MSEDKDTGNDLGRREVGVKPQDVPPAPWPLEGLAEGTLTARYEVDGTYTISPEDLRTLLDAGVIVVPDKKELSRLNELLEDR